MAIRVETATPPSTAAAPVAAAKKSRFKKIILKVAKIAKVTLFIGACAALYFFNPNVFAVSFAIGFLSPNKCSKELQKVKDFIKENKLLSAAVIGAGAFLALPVAWMLLSVGCGMNLGVKLAGRAEKQRKARQAAAAA